MSTKVGAIFALLFIIIFALRLENTEGSSEEHFLSRIKRCIVVQKQSGTSGDSYEVNDYDYPYEYPYQDEEADIQRRQQYYRLHGSRGKSRNRHNRKYHRRSSNGSSNSSRALFGWYMN